MPTTLDMKSARNVQPINLFAAARGYSFAELVCKKTSSSKLIHRIRFDGAYEFKISPKAYRMVSEGELSLSDLQYAEYCVLDSDEWVSLFVPMGAKIVSEDVLAKTSF